jgi:DNA invertase Pin-like site-specific DNA recombinase
MNQANKIKYFLYARKSSEGDDRQIQSIDDQVNRLKELAANLKLDIVKIYTEAKSAKKPNNRPLFDEMLKRIENGEANGILCWQINRLSRNPIDSGKIIWLLQRGVLEAIQTIDREYLPDDNVLLMNVESGMANQYILDLSKNVKRGIDGKLRKGWRPGSAPQGYLNSKFKDRGENDISKDPERFPLVRKMWDLMLTGNYTVPQILKKANDEWGYRTRKTKRMGGNPLGESTLYRIFTNIFYAGIIEHLGQQYQGKHEAMITPLEYDRVQILLGREGKPRTTKRAFAFTGLIRCQECGCLYTAEIKKKIIKKTGEIKEYTYYHCTRRTIKIKCTQKKVLRDDDLELQIEDELDKYTILPEFLHWAIERIDENKETNIDCKSKIKDMQQKAIEQTENELRELGIMRRRQLINDEDFLRDKKELEAKITQLKGELKDPEAKSEKWIKLEEKTFNFATYARSKFLNGGLELKREILAGIGENRKIKNKKLDIVPYEWFEMIGKNYPELEAEYLGLEPMKMSNFENKTEALASIISRWQALLEDFRTLDWAKEVPYPEVMLSQIKEFLN